MAAAHPRASFTLRGALTHLSRRTLRDTVEARVFGKGTIYHAEGRVTGLGLHGGRLRAWVSGSRARPYLVECEDAGKGTLHGWCSCPYASDWKLPCKHVVALLLAWIAQRDGRDATGLTWPRERASAGRVSPPPGPGAAGAVASATRLTVRPFPRGLPAWTSGLSGGIGPWPDGAGHRLPMAWMLATQFFSGAHSLRGEVVISEDGTTLEVVLAADDPQHRATLRIPRQELANFIAHFRAASDLAWRGGAGAVRMQRRFAEPRLLADYDGQERLTLEMRYALSRKPGQPERLLTMAELNAGRIGAQWFWDHPSGVEGGGGLYPIAPIPRRLRPYVCGEAPRMYEGAAIPRFFETAYRALAREIAFRPSARVERTRLLPPPAVSHVKLDLDGPDWLWCEPTYLAGDHRLALGEILQAQGSFIRKGDDWIRMPDQAQALEELGQPAPEAIADGRRARLSRLQFLRARAGWDPDRVQLEESEAARHLRELIDRVAPAPDPPPLEGRMSALRPYQREGYRWLWSLHVNGFHGLLADEMGLGKTHQAMALLCAATPSAQPDDPATQAAGTDGQASAALQTGVSSLVVCPTSVLDHWADKLRRYAPALRYLRVHGPERPTSLAGLARPPVVLTTYAMLAREPALFEAVEWEYVILDEAQKIKNAATKTARAARRLRARHRLALTGTPLENRPMELWAIFEFLLPGYVGSARAFHRRFERPIVQHGDAEAVARLNRLAHPFKLRRCKAEVLQELPPKVEDARWCELTGHQAVLYRETLQRSGWLVDRLRDRARPIDYLHIFAALTRLKRICDHPALVLSGARARALASAKFTLLLELLDEALAGGQKVVIFSQYLEMLDLIAAALEQRGVEHVQLRGATRERWRVIERFQQQASCRVFLGSLLAGGLGIDLTAASVVIHYDRWWNAAREDQATDRVHRIGQSRGVQVFKLITKGTLEERIHRMIERKRSLMDALVTSDVGRLKTFSRAELLALLSANP